MTSVCLIRAHRMARCFSFASWLVIFFMAAMLLMLSQAQAQTQPVSQPQVELPLINPVSSTLTGTYDPSATVQADPNNHNSQVAVPDSCEFSLTLAAGQPAVEARRTSDISVDAASNTCSAQFNIGQPPVETTPSAAELANDANTTSDSSSDVPTQADSSTPAPVTSSSVVSAGYMKTWYVDPINITVNSVENTTTWRWSGSGQCVTGLLGGWRETWFTPSGWQRISNGFRNVFYCSETTSASYVLYQNSIFCVGLTTQASYSPNKVNGRQNGDLVGTWRDSVFGAPCSDLLHLRTQLKRTQN